MKNYVTTTDKEYEDLCLTIDKWATNDLNSLIDYVEQLLDIRNQEQEDEEED